MKFLKKYLFIFLLGIFFAYVIFYGFYTFNDKLNNALNHNDAFWKYLSEISIFLFTAGIFSATLKYLQFLGVFEKEFRKVVISSEFEEILEKKISQVTFSEEFLLDQSNLDEIYKKVTLCMYNKQFPELNPKMEEKVNNDLFKKNVIEYYYKNMQSHYEIKLLENGLVAITDKSSYTVVRPNNDKFEWDVTATYLDDNKSSSKIHVNVINMENRDFNDDNATIFSKDGFINKRLSLELSGRKEYHIERTIEAIQDIDKDRVFSFGSDRIIDDLSFSVKHCEKLGVYVEKIWYNKLYPDNSKGKNDIAFINRDLLLPGEKYKIFIFRKN